MLYELDCEAVAAKGGDVIGVATNVIALFQQLPPDFRREDMCRGCEIWEASKVKPIDRPSRPGAHNPGESCEGCLLALVDAIPGSETPRIGGLRWCAS